MSSRTLPSTTLPLLVLALFCLGCAFATSTVYLSPTGAPEWDGNCNAQCYSEQPCGLPNTAISTTPANITCYLHLLGGRYTTPMSIKQSDNETTLNVTLGANDGGVQGIALSLNAYHIIMSGSVTNGTLTVSMDATKTVNIIRLASVDSSFRFVGDSAPSIESDILITDSNFTYLPATGVTAQELVSIFVRDRFLPWFAFARSDRSESPFISKSPLEILALTSDSLLLCLVDPCSTFFDPCHAESTPILRPFSDRSILQNFDLPAGATTRRTFKMVGGIVQLDSNYSGLIYSTGGSAPYSVRFFSTRITNPGAFVTFKETTATDLMLMDTTATGVSHFFKSLTPIDPTSFNSSVAPLKLKIDTSTVTGPNFGFGQVYDPNACVSIALSVSSLSGFEINCNAPDSTNDKDRCDAQFSQSQMIDNHLCMFGTPSSSYGISETNFVVTVPLKAPVMTWFRDVSLYFAARASLLTVGNASATNDTSIAYLFSGINKIPDFPFVSFNDITMDTGAQLDIDMANFSGVVKMRSDSIIRFPGSSSRVAIFGHTRFVMDGEGTATIDVTRTETFYLSADANSAKTAAPIADVGPGISFLVHPSSGISNYFVVDWASSLERPSNRSYPLINNAIYNPGIPPLGDRFALAGYGFMNPDFTGWFEPNQCSDGLCYSLTFGLESAFPKKQASSFCQGVDLGPRFSCVNGELFCVGSLQINHTMEIWHFSSVVYIHGDVTFGPGGSLRLVGEGAGIQLSGCLYSPEEAAVTLDYTQGWPKSTNKWSQNAIIQSTNCKSSRTPIPYKIATPHSCKTSTVTPRAGTKNGLTVDWTLDTHRCVLWWSLGLGLGGGALLLIIGIIIFVVVRRRRAAARERHPLLGQSDSEHEPLNTTKTRR